MPQHIWEKTPIECSAEYAGKRNKKCQFKFFEGSKVVHVLDASLSGVLRKTWKGKWKARACAADELSYALTLKVFVDGEEKKDYQREYRVFADDMTVTAELVGTGPLVGAELELHQVDPTGTAEAVTVSRVTGDGGKLTYELALPSDVQIRWKRPWVIDHWENETSRKPKAHLVRAFVAKLAFPDPTVDPDPDPRPDPKTPRQHVQWVNLAYDSAKPSQGSKIRIKVGAKDPSKAEAGDRVYLQAAFGSKNNARKTEDDGHAPGAKVSLDSTLGGDKTATFELELGPAGGDEVEIKVGGLADCTDDDVKIVTWRMLLYDVCAPDTLALEDGPKLGGGTGKTYPAAMRTWFDAVLAKAFVAYVLRGSSVTAATGEPYKSSMLPKSYFGGSGGPDLYVRGVSDTRPSGFGAGDLRCVRVVFCDKAFAADSTRSPFSESVTIDASPFDFSVWNAHKEYVFERRMGPVGGDAIIPLAWRADVDPKKVPSTHPGLDNGKPRKGSVDRSWIKAKNLCWLQITLPPEIASFVGPASDTKCPVVLGFKVYTAFEINGSAAGANQVMVLRGDKPTAVASTVCHELGHSAGLTVYPTGVYKRKPPPGIAAPKPVPKGTTYVGKGHTGSHCAEGLSATDRKLASYQGKVGSCIMFGEGGAEPATRTAFCASCLSILLARRLVDISSDWANRKSGDL
ncbi:MAG: hypothetical protein IT379_11220 [Deltaproteobacteria bacterium]|nr:hypothetical protein [Deltaproteobacteria bacterium]